MANGLLGTSFDDPRTRFNLATAMGLLEAGGPSLQPTSFGQTLGRAGMMGMQAYDAALQSQRAKKLEDLQFRAAEAELAKAQAEAAEKRRMATALGRYKMAATPEMRAQIYATEIDPLGAAKFQMEQRAKAPTTQEFLDPATGRKVLRAYNPQTRRFDIDMGPTARAPDPKTITSGGVTGTMGRDIFGRSTFVPLPGAPVTPSTIPTPIITGDPNVPGGQIVNIPVPDPSQPSGVRLEQVGAPRRPKPATGTVTSIDPETGQITISQGVPGADLAKPTIKAIEGQILETQDVLSQLDSIAQAYDPSFQTIPTQLENYAQITLEKLTGVPPSDQEGLIRYSQFRAQTQNLFSTILKQLSGAAVTKFELENARRFLPDVNDSPTQFKAKLNNFRSVTAAALYRAQQLRSGNDKITDNLARKYPLSLQTQGGQTMYIDDYVRQWMAKPENAGKTQADALQVWADSAAARR
jgi:hypothetical protein